MKIWRPKLIGSTDQFGGLQCILVDQKTDAIQASVKEIDYDFVAPKIKAGSIYEITHFYTGRNKPSHKIVPHVAQLFFNARTTFKELPTIQPHIPRHRFYLVDYTQLSTRIDKIDILTGKIVLNSSVSTLIFINPDIQELAAYKTIFSDSTHAVKMMPSSTTQLMTPQYLEAAKKLSVQELNVLDPETHKDTPILCRAAITRFDIRNGWWYKACPSCFKQLRTAAHRDELLCPKHNNQIPLPWFKVSLVLEDSTDETNAIIIGKQQNNYLKFLAMNWLFKELRFGSMRSDFNRNDLLIQAVFDDTMPLIEPTPQSPDQSLAAHDAETIGAQMIPPITPAFSKPIPSASSTSSADVSMTEVTPSSKKDIETL
ncbi:hypothetical protein Prudu_022115 [Prunus dulcis]|uniref:Replication factor A C-terminal domain-containing protein n=1 Tax=Prunus dulcis TaxID=3755 RepID=A0A4Y1RYT1_PRUDU|nr:hypothetical protein Prudu_022115 [Prunus dulcis]